MTGRDVDKAEIQAIVRTAFGRLKGASYLLLRVVDARAARRWLGGLEPATLACLGSARTQIEEAIQVALTAAGLRSLEVAEDIVRRFAPEFVEGLAGSENRSGRLGDFGANAPANWQWGVGDREPHILVMLVTKRTSDIDTFAMEKCAEAERNGLVKLEILGTSDMGGVEPFGFRDGISQPSFDWEGARTPGTKADRVFTNLIALGEVLLGY